MEQTPNTDGLTETIMQIIKENKPDDVNQLVALLRDRVPLKEKQALDAVLVLENQGKIRFETQSLYLPLSFKNYLKTSQALWYWVILAISALTLLMVFGVPEGSLPLSYFRNALGIIFVLWLPGYSFIKVLFPVQVPIKTSTESLDAIERIILSLGMSLALVPLVGLLLNYTPWGIRLTPLVLSFLTLSLVFATVAIVREHRTKMKAIV